MSRHQRFLEAAALVSLASLQTGCVDLVAKGVFVGLAEVVHAAHPRRDRELRNSIQVSSNDDPGMSAGVQHRTGEER